MNWNSLIITTFVQTNLILKLLWHKSNEMKVFDIVEWIYSNERSKQQYNYLIFLVLNKE